MTANSLTHVVEWLRRSPKVSAQIRNIIPLFATALLVISLIFSLKGSYSNDETAPRVTMPPFLEAFPRVFLEVSLALSLSILTIFVALGKRRFVFILLFLLLPALLGPIAISVGRGNPLSPKGVAQYIREGFVSVVLIVPLLVTPRLLIWAAGRSAIDINTASKQELESLPGIGSMLAQRIIERRPFKKVEDLGEVPGIGGKLVSQMKYKLKVGRAVEPR